MTGYRFCVLDIDPAPGAGAGQGRHSVTLGHLAARTVALCRPSCQQALHLYSSELHQGKIWPSISKGDGYFIAI